MGGGRGAGVLLGSINGIDFGIPKEPSIGLKLFFSHSTFKLLCLWMWPCSEAGLYASDICRVSLSNLQLYFHACCLFSLTLSPLPPDSLKARTGPYWLGIHLEFTWNRRLPLESYPVPRWVLESYKRICGKFKSSGVQQVWISSPLCYLVAMKSLTP